MSLQNHECQNLESQFEKLKRTMVGLNHLVSTFADNLCLIDHLSFELDLKSHLSNAQMTI